MGGCEVGYAADDSGGRRAAMTGRGGDTAEGANLYIAAVGEDSDRVLVWLPQKTVRAPRGFPLGEWEY
jgi:hypothetical protein